MKSAKQISEINPQYDLSSKTAAVGLTFISMLVLFYGRHLYAPCDDAYIFFVYAKNFVQGNGLTYNGVFVQGFTSVLWTVMLAVFGLTGIPIHVLGEVLSSLSGLFALGATYYLGRSLSLNRLTSLWLVLLLAVTGDFVFYTTVGLEQVLYTGLVALSAAMVISPRAPEITSKIVFPVVLALMILTRPEGFLVCALLLVILALPGRCIRQAVKSSLIVLILLVPVFILLRTYYGYWLPNTYYVKSNAGLANLPAGWQYLLESLPRYAAVLITGLLSAGLWMFRSGIRSAVKPLLLLVVVVIWLVNVVVQGGDNLVGGRMIIPILPLAYGMLFYFLPRVRLPFLLSIVCLLCLATVVLYNIDEKVASSRDQWRKTSVVRRQAGIYLREHFDPGTTVALNAAGIIPYYSELPTIDMLGLNNKHIAHHGKRDYTLRVGHQAGDGEYVLSLFPDIILFGGSMNQMPDNYISDREIAASPDFAYYYKYEKWEDIGIAFIKNTDIKQTTYSISPDYRAVFEGTISITHGYSTANRYLEEGPIRFKFKGNEYSVQGSRTNLPPTGCGTFKWTAMKKDPEAGAETPPTQQSPTSIDLFWLYDNCPHPADIDQTLILGGPFRIKDSDGTLLLEQLDKKNDRFRTIHLKRLE